MVEVGLLVGHLGSTGGLLGGSRLRVCGHLTLPAVKPASAHAPSPGIRVHSLTLAHGRAEVRAHLVTGAPDGTSVRQTGWATTPEGPTAQLQPVHGYTVRTASDTGSTLQGPRTRTAALHGTTGGRPATLLVALASLTAEPAPAPVTALADVEIDGHTLTVTWQDGTTSVRTCGPPWS
ncbi:hypothetical protein ACWGI8_12505 [Streptomyces sp. NPDC054841]